MSDASDYWEALSPILPALMKMDVVIPELMRKIGAKWPEWMEAPIRPIEPGKLDDLQAKTAEQERWLEEIRAKDERAERAEREFQVLRKMQAATETKLREFEERARQANPIFAEGVRAYDGAQAARIAFEYEKPTPKPKNPAGPPILPLDTPRRFFED